MRRAAIKTVILLLLFGILFSCCLDGPSAPIPDNPLDPENSQTHGDPFQLQAVLLQQGVRLFWQPVHIILVERYLILRDQIVIGSVNADTLMYWDKTTLKGRTYVYQVAAKGKNGQVSYSEYIKPETVHTQPMVQILPSPATAIRQISLLFTAAHAQKVCISNSSDFDQAVWLPFAQKVDWLLPPGDGLKIVYIKTSYADSAVSPVMADSVFLDTTPPIVRFSVTPDSGQTAAVAFHFNATASFDAVSERLYFEWDTDGDGQYDQHDWELQDFYFGIVHDNLIFVRCKVTDQCGNSDSSKQQVYVNAPPFVTLSITPDNTAIDTDIRLDASGSTDQYDQTPQLSCRFDFEGDGIWDTGYTSELCVNHRYTQGGELYPACEIRDRLGAISKSQSHIFLYAEKDNMVYVPAGEFTMGGPEVWTDGPPVQKKYVEGFWIDKYEVTNAQYKKFCIATWHCYPRDRLSDYFHQYPNYPVLFVTYQDAEAYAAWAGKRLPMSAEWEKACRAFEYYNYPWGNNEPSNQCNFWYYAGPLVAQIAKLWYECGPLPVGSFAPNRLGLYDMAGNAWEFCSDWWGKPYDPENSATQMACKIIRGGGWNSVSSQMLRCAYFSGVEFKSYYDNNLGFRCARSE